MAADAYNSAGGYSVGIPPINVIDLNGNITAPKATIAGNLVVGGNIAISGDISATNFYGNVQGNISANISITGTDGTILYNDNSLASTAEGVIYNKNTKSLVIEENLTANSFALGLGVNQFYEISSFTATTNSDSPNQVLHRIPANTLCGVEYTVIATDPVANTRQISKLNAIVLGSDVGYAEFGTADSPADSPGVGDFKVNFEPFGLTGSVTLTVTPIAAHTTDYKILIISYKA